MAISIPSLRGVSRGNLPLCSVILSVTKDLKACTTFIGRANSEILHFVQNDTLFVFLFAVILSVTKDLKACTTFVGRAN